MTILDAGLEINAHDPKTSLLRRSDVHIAFCPRRVRVIDSERLLRAETLLKERSFAVSCFQHVEADVDVRALESLAIESRLTRTLQADEDDCFHDLRASMTVPPDKWGRHGDDSLSLTMPVSL
jgi:hypothetical protein